MQKSRAKRLSPTGAVLITLAVCLAAFLLAVLRHTTGADGSSAVRRVNVSQVKSVKVLENGNVRVTLPMSFRSCSGRKP